MIRKILIANRGEIACRIIRTARRLDIRTVAIYSDIDKYSRHVSLADQSYHIGPNPSSQSYLNGSKILDIALNSNCQALHPGFGFLSENADFADLCEQNKLIFIGPPSSAIRMMGSKSESKKIMINANVPVVPGYHGEDQEKEKLLEEAKKIGFPIMIKAVLGGGGKGMRIVRKAEEFYENLESSKREALKSFKDDRVLIEKYIEKPRHIEIQVFGDHHKNYVHLFERDCSIQRRHQKVVEEAPSNIDEILRTKIGQSAIEAARAVGYYNAGTVEFIFDTLTNEYFFMEMNTRLQVEHPITEFITGQDLVEWQIRVANGEKLPKKQEDLKINGHAIETRIYSEDPFRGFLPANGKLKFLKEPEIADGKVRIDSGIRENDEISIFYDPMIAKLVVWASNRAEAIKALAKALSEYRIIGLPNNVKFLKNVCSNPEFLAGNFDTSFIQLNEKSLIQMKKNLSCSEIVSCVISQILKEKTLLSKNNLPNDFVYLRTNYHLKRKYLLSVKGQHIDSIPRIEAEVTYLGDNKVSINIVCGANKYSVEKVEYSLLKDHILLNINGEITKKQYFFEENTCYTFDETNDVLEIENESDILLEPSSADDNSLGIKMIKTPMPGTLIKLNVKEGEKVKKGTVLCILEAMKMEHVIKAHDNMSITKIHCKEGGFIEAAAKLIEFEKD